MTPPTARVRSSARARSSARVRSSARARARGLGVVVVAFVLSRAAYLAAGVRFDGSALHPSGRSGNQMQLLDLHLLSHELLRSIWYLDSQPPLYNLYCGILLHLPEGLRVPAAAACFWLLGLVMAACTFLLLVELRVPVWLATVVSLVVVASPTTVLYENWLSWSYPAAALLTAGTYCCARYLRSRRTAWGVGCVACFAAVVLDDSTFQILWLVAVVAVLLVFLRLSWRQVLVAAAVPLLLVVGWYAKDAVLFGTVTTSSWTGMNLASTTITPAPPSQVRRLVRQGRLSPLALEDPFAPVDDYDPRFVKVKATGVEALDERRKPDGAVNFNNLVYVRISDRYLREDLSYIEAEPVAYASRVGTGAEIWLVPADQYGFLDANLAHIAGYDHAFDTWVLWQPQQLSAWDLFFVLRAGISPPLGTMSYLTLIEFALVLLAAPVMIVLRRRDRVVAGTIAVAVVTAGYSFVVTSLVSLGENERFRFELGTVPVVVAVAVVVWAVRSIRGLRAPAPAPAPALAVGDRRGRDG